MHAWRQLISAVRGPMELRRYELATLAAAGALKSRYCVGAHADVVLSKGFFTMPELEAVMSDRQSATLDEVDIAVMDLAEKVALDSSKVTDADFEALRRHGLADAEILDVVLAAAARCFFSKTLDAMGAEIDDAYAATSELVDIVGSRSKSAVPVR
jgi:alkylhydroperoxidase family enzyme